MLLPNPVILQILRSQLTVSWAKRLASTFVLSFVGAAGAIMANRALGTRLPWRKK
jgi:hypothetical protein